MVKMSIGIRLPDGNPSYNPDEFAREWQKLIDPLEKGLSIRVSGFDPGFSVEDINSNNTSQIPMWLAKRIINIIQRNDNKYFDEYEDMKIAHEDRKCLENCIFCDTERSKIEFVLDEAKENALLDDI